MTTFRARLLLLAITVAFVLFPSFVFAETATVNGITWTYTLSNGNVTLGAGLGKRAVPTSTTGDLVIPSTIGGHPVTRIGYYAFEYCGNLTSITMPDSVVEIEIGAFSCCSGLSSITFSSNLSSIGGSAFGGCEGLVSVSIPDSVKHIGHNAFPGKLCTTNLIQGVSIVDGWVVKSDSSIPTNLNLTGTRGICDSAFYGQAGLYSIRIPGTVCGINSAAFENCGNLTNVELEEGVSFIGEETFLGCSNLTSVTIPNSVNLIGKNAFPDSTFDRQSFPGLCLVDGWVVGADKSISGNVDLTGIRGIAGGAFSDCAGIVSVNIPDGVKSLGNWSFSQCSSLTSISLPNSVFYLGDHAFEWCYSLTTVEIPGIVEVGTAPFYACQGITNVLVNSSVKLSEVFTSSYQQIFAAIISPDSTEIPDKAFAGCSRLTHVTLPLSIDCIGNESFRGCSNLLDISLPNSITNIGSYAFYGCTGLSSIMIPDKVTSIGAYAFYGCTGLSSIMIPDKVESIGAWAFDGCVGLMAVHVSDLTAWCRISFGGERSNPCYYAHHLFTNNTEVTALVIPNGITCIGNWAFDSCSGLTSITIPNSVTRIEDEAFEYCDGLKAVTIPDSITRIGDRAFWGCGNLTSVIIPASVTSVGSYAFQGCTKIQSVVVPGVFRLSSLFRSGYETILHVIVADGSTEIADSAFLGCSKLESVQIPESVSSIGDNAFSSCVSISSITIPGNVSTLGENAFRNCIGLTTVSIPKSVTSIGDNVFSGCRALSSILVEENNSVYSSANGLLLSHDGKIVLQGVNGDVMIPHGVTCIANNAFSGRSTLVSVEIPNSVTNIGVSAFSGCSGLLSITIPAGLSTIEDGVFSNCSCLSSVAIPTGITRIGNSSFSSCSRLTSVSIPESVMSIGRSAFSGCSGLTSIAIPESVTNIDDYAFSSCGNLSAVAISNSLTHVGSYAFRNCYQIDSVVMPGNFLLSSLFPASYQTISQVAVAERSTAIASLAFAGCSGLETISIPDSVRSIGNNAFSNCCNLGSASIPDAVTSIAYNAFYDCPMLYDTSTIPGARLVDGWAVGHESDLSGDLDLTGCRGIADRSFSGCTRLTSITIPDEMTSIGNAPFSGCSALATITIPERLLSFSATLLNGNSASIFVRSANGEIYQEYSTFSDSSLPDGQVGKRYRRKILAIVSGNGVATYSSANLPSGLSLSADGWITGVPSEAVENCSVTISTDNGQSHTFTLTIHPLGYDWLTSGIWKYEVKNDEAIIRYCTQQSGSVIVPETINGHPVRGIEAIYVADYDSSGVMTNIFIPQVVFWPNIYSVSLPSNLKNLGVGALAGSSISSLSVPSGVTNIGHYAVADCASLQYATLRPGLHDIGDAAFKDCISLHEIAVPNSVVNLGVHVFDNCLGMQTASLGSGCGTIPTHTFYNCQTLTSVFIPASVTNIESGAFLQCASLPAVDIPESVRGIGTAAFMGCSSLKDFNCPDRLEGIADQCFFGCFSLTNFVSSPLLEGFLFETFGGCESLGEIVLPPNCRLLGKGCFVGCTSLTNVVWNDRMEVVDEWAFENCLALPSLRIPDSVYILNNAALRGCTNLSSLSIPFGGITTNYQTTTEWSGFGAIFGSVAYEGGVETVQAFDPEQGLAATWYLPGTLKTVELRGNSLAPGAFSGCRTLENVRLTGAPVRIPDYAFAGCEGIRTISLPDSVEEIGAAAFGSCSTLETVHLSTGLRTVDLIPFWQCTNLTEATWGTTGTLRMEDPDGRFFSLGTKTEEEDYLAWTVETENPRDWIEWVVADTGERRATGPTSGIRLSDTRSFLVRVTDMSTTAVDTVVLRFHDTASAPWIVTEDESAKGGFCLRSGEIPASTNSTIETTISGPGRLSFKWKISAGRGDFCKFYLDGTETNSIGTRNGAMTDWTTVALDLPEDSHTLRWSYERGSGDAAGEDAAFLDDVDWRPEVSLSVASAWGDATPATGLHTVLCGDEIEASVVAPPVEGGMRRVCSGWTGTGIVPASGTGSNALFVVTNDASLVWNWRNEYWTSVSVSGGTTSFAPMWVTENEMVSVEILPTPHLYTISLSGDTDGAVVEGTILRFPADKPRMIQVEVSETTATLTVSSAHGNPSPGTGSHSFAWGTTVSASVASAIQLNGTKHECTGWTGTGSVPSHGSGSNVSFSITNDSSIVWNWKTMYKTQLNVIGGSGDIRLNNAVTIGNNGEIWSSSGASLRFDVTPAFHLYNVTLTGDTQGVTLSGTTLSCVADRPRSITMLIEEVKLPLTVASALGFPSPTNGVHALSWGTEVAACVAEPEPADGVRYVCAGWTGTGSVPASGDGTNVAFRIEEVSSIRWNWRTNVWIALSTSGPVSADFAEAWTNLGETIVAGWTPSVPYFTVALSGDTDGVTLDEAARTVSIPADRPRSVALSVTELTLAGSLDAPWLVWTTDGEADWFPQVATSADGDDAARSGSVLGSQASTIQTILEGSGTFSWTWRLDSATGGNAGVDVLLDGSWKSLYAPGADWSRESLAIVGEGPHVVRFEFWNAGTEATADDCAYLDQVSWTGEVPGGRKIDVNGVGIPVAWIETNAPAALAAAGGNYEAAAKSDASNGENKIWECYVAGLNPTDAADRFLAIVNTTNGTITVNWTPDLNEGGTKNLRVYTVEGKTNLVDRSWGATNEATRFFRVKVSMPEE